MSVSKREELILNAFDSFYKGGFHAIGMDRLAKETGVSKTAIYKHFRTKEDLILAALRYRDEQFRNDMRRTVEARASTPRERMVALFDWLTEWFGEPDFRSCMFTKASSEFQDRDNPIHAISAEHKKLVERYVEDLATKAGAGDPKFLASQLMLVMEGAIVLAHLYGKGEVSHSTRETARQLIDAALEC